MTLRTRFFALFTLLAVIPMVAVGAFGFIRSIRAVRSLVATQVEQIARTASHQVEDRYALHQANLLLLAGNAETQRLYEAMADGDSAAIASARSAAAAYLDEAWRALGAGYEWIELRDDEGRVIYRMAGGQAAPSARPGADRGADRGVDQRGI